MTTPIPEVAVATIFHECWLDEGRDARSFVRGTATLSEAAAKQAILDETHDGRDFDEWPDDEEWLDECQSEGWTILISYLE